MSHATLCLWYDKAAEEAARFYAQTFPNSRVNAVHRAPADYPAGKAGDVLVVRWVDRLDRNYEDVLTVSYGHALYSVRCWAAQLPYQTRRRVVELDLAANRRLRHRSDDCRAKASALRRRHRWPLAFRPAHRESVAVGRPANIDTTPIRRERPVLPGVGRKLVHCETYRLGGGCVQTQLRAVHSDP